jgi:CO/xanthine dehydrogenase Mo-binding subunit
VVRSVHAHANLLRIDLAAARRRPGVVAAFTAREPPEAGAPIPTPYGATPRARPSTQPVLARDTVRAAGEPVAVVVADDPYRLADGLAYVAVHDSGRAINPVIVEGQLQGGVVQGIGAALWEELVYDGQGQLVTGSLMDYAIPRADQVPGIVTALLDHPSAVNELGVKGVGESGSIAPAAAVANAVKDALAEFGITTREAPVTPARLFGELRAAGVRLP